MDCAECSELLPLYTTGDLNDSERTMVEEHLIHCWQCQAEIKEVRSVTQALFSLFEDVKQKVHVYQEMNPIIRKRNRERFIRHATCTFLKKWIKDGLMGELAAIVGIHGVGGSIRAFTNAIRPITAGRSAVFQGTYQINGQPIRLIDGGFIRPGLAYHTIEAGEDAGQKHTIVTNYLRGKALMIIPSIKTALIIQLDNGPVQLNLSKTDGSEKLRNLIKQAQINFSGEVEYKIDINSRTT